MDTSDDDDLLSKRRFEKESPATSRTKTSRKASKKSSFHLFKEKENSAEMSPDKLRILFHDVIEHEMRSPRPGPISGDSWQAVLNNLLQTMKISTKSSEDFEAVLANDVPKSVRERCTKGWHKMDAFLQRISFQDSAPYLSKTSYAEIAKVLEKEAGSYGRSFHPSDDSHIEHLFSSLETVATYMLWDKDRLQKEALQLYWTQLWTSVLRLVTITTLQEKDESNGTKVCIREKGERTMMTNFRVEDPPSSGEEVVVEVTAEPDGLCEMFTYGSRREQLILFVLEVETSGNELDPFTMSGTDSSSSGEVMGIPVKHPAQGASVPSPAPGEESLPRDSLLDKIKTQHLWQLILSLRVRGNELWPYAFSEDLAAFGLFAVLNRVYLTSLRVRKKGVRGLRLGNAERILFIREEKSSAYKQHGENGLYFDVQCSDYLDLFNPVHLKALLRYVQILVWHRINETREGE